MKQFCNLRGGAGLEPGKGKLSHVPARRVQAEAMWQPSFASGSRWEQLPAVRCLFPLLFIQSIFRCLLFVILMLKSCPGS